MRRPEQLEGAAVVPLVGRNRLEVFRETGVGDGAVRRLIDVGPLEHAEPVVDCAVDVHDVRALAQQLDRRQEPLPLQPVSIEQLGLDVRRGGERHAAREQRGEQRAENHRVGDVGDRELVEADDPRLLGDPVRDELERILDGRGARSGARARTP